MVKSFLAIVIGIVVLSFTESGRAGETRSVCCPGDMDASGQVSEGDVPLFVSVLLNQSGTPDQLCSADLNIDGAQNGADIHLFVPRVINGNVCFELTGGCCTGGGSCQVVTAIQCAAASGCYQGDGTICSPNPCACAVGTCDVDGLCSNGCEFNLNSNPSCTPQFLGQVNGDTSGLQITHMDTGEHWYSVRLFENNNGNVFLSARVDLQSGPTSDYDLVLRCLSCGGAVIGTSTNGTGQVDTLFTRNDDDFLVDDTFFVIIEVRWFSGSCEPYQLVVTGNVATAANNCDP